MLARYLLSKPHQVDHVDGKNKPPYLIIFLFCCFVRRRQIKDLFRSMGLSCLCVARFDLRNHFMYQMEIFLFQLIFTALANSSLSLSKHELAFNMFNFAIDFVIDRTA